MPEPTPVPIVIADGGGGKAIFPDTNIAIGDSVFWLNKTSLAHQPVYRNAVGQLVLWGPPPEPLPPQKQSSQVVFYNAGSYRYSCAIPGHSGETGLITVKAS